MAVWWSAAPPLNVAPVCGIGYRKWPGAIARQPERWNHAPKKDPFARGPLFRKTPSLAPGGLVLALWVYWPVRAPPVYHLRRQSIHHGNAVVQNGLTGAGSAGLFRRACQQLAPRDLVVPHARCDAFRHVTGRAPPGEHAGASGQCAAGLWGAVPDDRPAISEPSGRCALCAPSAQCPNGRLGGRAEKSAQHLFRPPGDWKLCPLCPTARAETVCAGGASLCPEPPGQADAGHAAPGFLLLDIWPLDRFFDGRLVEQPSGGGLWGG